MDKVNPDKDQDLSSRNTFDRTYANNDNNEIKNKNDRNTFDRTYEINQTHNISDQIISTYSSFIYLVYIINIYMNSL